MPGATRESLRTHAFPRNFDAAEFWRGAFIAWAVFQPIGIAVLAWSIVDWPVGADGAAALIGAAAYYWLIGGVVTTAVVTLLGAPLPYGIGRLLRGIRQDWIHAAAFLAYGVVVGCVALGAGVAVALGWLITSRIALAADRKRLAVD